MSLPALALLLGLTSASPIEPAPRRVILFVWDGLRPDCINANDTPTLWRVAAEGTQFADHHATYPTFTMLNAAAFATGNAAGVAGFYGNNLWQPHAHGKDAQGRDVDFNQPIFTEDHALLRDLRDAWNGQLVLVPHLFGVAQRAALPTAAVGKSGPAFLQDYSQGGVALDERMATPLSFVQALRTAGFAVPHDTEHAFPPGTVVSFDSDPTAMAPKRALHDGVTTDPTDDSGGPAAAANRYLMETFVRYILIEEKPRLSVVWLRHPDSAQHFYGVGTRNALAALRAQDQLLGTLLDALRTADASPMVTDLLIASDHGHSSISGPLASFPLRGVRNGTQADVDPTGYSVSGMVRLADLLAARGFHAFDGAGCLLEPVMSGIRADGSPVHPAKIDADGSVCGRANTVYSTPAHKVPSRLPADAVVIAANGGSEYLYVPSHDPTLVSNLVHTLHTREELGAVFVDSRYGALPGALSLRLIASENTSGRSPDIIVSYTHDANASIAGLPGIEFASMMGQGMRGMHGSFSRIDVHNVLIAHGSDFRRGFVDQLPSGNVDVAPTIAHLLRVDFPSAAGRPLLEALANASSASTDYHVTRDEVRSTVARNIRMELPTFVDGSRVDTAHHDFTTVLHTSRLVQDNNTYTYLDDATGLRE